MRCMTKVSLVILLIGSASVIPFLWNYEALAEWPNERLASSLASARTAGEMLALIGRPPDVQILPDPKAKNGLTQWVWTNDRRKSWGYPEFGWVSVFILPDDSVMDCEIDPSISLMAFLKERGHDLLQRAGIEQHSAITFECTLDYWKPMTLPSQEDTSPQDIDVPKKVREIQISGALRIPDRLISRIMKLSKGATLSANVLAKAESNLVESGLFLVDELNQVRPTIMILNSERPGSFKDILVDVQERQ
jgi:Surface antigen variable number repeat